MDRRPRRQIRALSSDARCRSLACATQEHLAQARVQLAGKPCTAFARSPGCCNRRQFHTLRSGLADLHDHPLVRTQRSNVDVLLLPLAKGGDQEMTVRAQMRGKLLMQSAHIKQDSNSSFTVSPFKAQYVFGGGDRLIVSDCQRRLVSTQRNNVAIE